MTDSNTSYQVNGSFRVDVTVKQQTMKRQLDDVAGAEAGGDGSQVKNKQKLFPIFQQRSAPATSSADSQFCWLPPLGPQQTCLHGIHLNPTIFSKLAIFDLDGTLTGSPFSKKSAKDTRPKESQWNWWHGQVVPTLRKLHNEGYSIIIASNQNLKPQLLSTWKKKIPSIASAIPDVPFRIFAATAKDGYRKPMPGIWYEALNLAKESGVEIIKDQCFFVGDAAGRARDHAATDRKWALNIGLNFFTPEQYFLNIRPTPYKLTGFDPSSLLENESVVSRKSSTYVVAPDAKTSDVVMFVGLPVIGKSTFYERHFAPAGYKLICPANQGGRIQCMKILTEAIQQGLNCVIDDTNEDTVTRKVYINQLRNMAISIRCFSFEGSVELAWHNNLYRAFCKPMLTSVPKQPKIIPYIEISRIQSNLVKPNVSEGFSEIRQINFVFEGDQMERELWSMRLQIDGK